MFICTVISFGTLPKLLELVANSFLCLCIISHGVRSCFLRRFRGAPFSKSKSQQFFFLFRGDLFIVFVEASSFGSLTRRVVKPVAMEGRWISWSESSLFSFSLNTFATFWCFFVSPLVVIWVTFVSLASFFSFCCQDWRGFLYTPLIASGSYLVFSWTLLLLPLRL